jgi:hypothetical protein
MRRLSHGSPRPALDGGSLAGTEAPEVAQRQRWWTSRVAVLVAVALVLAVVVVIIVKARGDKSDELSATGTTVATRPGGGPNASVGLASTFFPDAEEVRRLALTQTTPLPSVAADATQLPVSNEHRAAFAANGVLAELDQLLAVPGIDPAHPDQAPVGETVSFHVTVDVFEKATGAAATRAYVLEQLRGNGYQRLPRGTRPVALQRTFQGLTTTQGIMDDGRNVLVRVVGVCNHCFPGQAPRGFDALLGVIRGRMAADHTPEELAAIEEAADRARVVEIWETWTDVWKQGTDQGLAYIEAHDYPGLPAAPDFCRKYFGVTGPGFRVHSTVRPDSIKPDPTWTIPHGRLQGTKPEGRVYVMTVDQLDTAGTRTSVVAHVSVVNGRPLLFFDCTL